MNNRELQALIKENGFKQWQIAEEIGISEGLLCKKFRKELPTQLEEKIRQAIKTLENKRGE